MTVQGSDFKGADFAAWLKGMGTTPYHPESIGKQKGSTTP